MKSKKEPEKTPTQTISIRIGPLNIVWTYKTQKLEYGLLVLLFAILAAVVVAFIW